LGGHSEGLAVQFDQLLPHNPVGHRIDVNTDYVASQAVGFQQRCTPTHKGISDHEWAEIVALEESLCQRLTISEFC
jgi:hypothetical protein